MPVNIYNPFAHAAAHQAQGRSGLLTLSAFLRFALQLGPVLSFEQRRNNHSGASGIATRDTAAIGMTEASAGGCAASSSKCLPSHHVEDAGALGPRFRNPWETYEARSFSHVWQWHRERRRAGLPPSGEGHLVGISRPTAQDYRRAFPLAPVDWPALANPPADGVQAVWVGHATVLVQMGGVTFITDPVFSDRCAPVQFAGPKRVVPPALTCTEPQMPPLDFVLLSHNHYDHLDAGSVRTLNRRYGKSLTWYVPLGLRPWFASEGVQPSRVVELDWWQSVEHTSPATGKSVTVTLVPAQHWSARGVLDRFRTLWGGYVVSAPRPPTPAPATASTTPAPAAANPGSSTAPSTPIIAFTESTEANGDVRAQAAATNSTSTSTPETAAASTGTGTTQSAGGAAPSPTSPSSPCPPAPSPPLRFYFVGDTGYCPVFKEIGERFGPIDLAAIPIGAYEPRWFMRPQHTNAEEGLQIARDVRARVGLGIHTATWALTDEPLDEPPARLQAALSELGLPASSFVTLQHGEKAVVVEGRLTNKPRTLPVQAS